MPEKNPFHFYSTDDRVETIGRLKFGVTWEAPQTARELYVLLWFRPGPKVWPYSSKPPLEEAWTEAEDDPQPYASSSEPPLKDWILPNWVEGEQLRAEAENARRRAFRIRRQIAEVVELLRHHDDYKNSNEPVDFIKLKSGDDREKLREVRNLIARPAQENALTPEVVSVVPASDRQQVEVKPDAARAQRSIDVERKQNREVVLNWLVGFAQNEANLDKHPLGLKDQVFEAAKEKWPSLERRGFDWAWEQVCTKYPVRWHKLKRSGPRKKTAGAEKSQR